MQCPFVSVFSEIYARGSQRGNLPACGGSSLCGHETKLRSKMLLHQAHSSSKFVCLSYLTGRFCDFMEICVRFAFSHGKDIIHILCLHVFQYFGRQSCI